MPSIINATTTNGVAVSGDNSGALALQTNNGTTAVTIDTSQTTTINSPSSTPLIVQSASTERMRIDSSGRVLVGSSTAPSGAGVKLNLYGGSGSTTTAGLQLTFSGSPFGGGAITSANSGGGMEFYTFTGNVGSESYSERMRITSAGDVGIGTTSPSSYGKLAVVGNGIASVAAAANNTCFFASSPASYTGYHFYANSSTAASTNWFHHLCYANSVAQFLVYGNGITQNAANSYGGISDIKLKENITIAGSQWNDVKALSKVVKKYQFINDPEKKVQLGFVAQDVQEISAGLIVHNPDIDSEGNKTGTETLGVAYSVAYMKAFKALGEALERIEKLEAEVQALKGVA